MDVGDSMNNDLVNCKVAVIDKDGCVHMMGKSNEAESHVEYFINYLEENNPNVDVSKLNIGSVRHDIGYIFVTLGDIIYFNDLDTAFLYFPNELTEGQVDTLFKLNLNEQKVAIFYDPIDFGSFKSFTQIGNENTNLSDALGEYFGDGAIGKKFV